MLQFHNQLTKKVDQFTPLKEGEITLYTCGPTVYSTPTVGNWASYVHWDTLVRTLRTHKYDVKRVMNITDVGHLVSDGDEGEDKLEKGARREGKTAWEVAEYYMQDFLNGMDALNLIPPTHTPRATEFIEEQLNLIRILKEKGYTYQISDGIYYDTAKFPTYGTFAGLDLDAQKAGARVEFNPEKRSASDFALWKFTPAGQVRDMEWETPADLLEQTSTATAMGFPGWHLECSAMALNLLGDTIDIHTGGIDHIPVHHTNEIAQSEAATGQRFANYWLHTNHLKVNGTKISKSLGNGYTLQDLEKLGFDPLDLRMAILQGHYRSEGNFTIEGLEAAHNRRLNWRNSAALRHQMHDTIEKNSVENSKLTVRFEAARRELVEALANDLNTPEALAVVDALFKEIVTLPLEELYDAGFLQFLETADELLGLELLSSTPDISDEQKMRLVQRLRAREEKDFATSDEIRDELLSDGIAVRDTPSGTVWEYVA